MKQNLGGVDRGIRIVMGVALVLVGLLVPMGGTVRIVCFLAGLIAILTGLLGFCGLYTLLGIDTRRRR